MNWKTLMDNVAMGLTFVGALAWGGVGLFSYNFVEAIFTADWLAKTVYVLVGASALWLGFKAIKK